MKDKYYKPVIKDNEHLVKSHNNPDRVRGLSRDENNKNQNIIEWEEVEAVSTREELEMQLEQAKIEQQTAEYKSNIADKEYEMARNDAIKTTLNTGLSALTALSENPEFVIGAYNFYLRIKNKVANIKNKRKTKVSQILEVEQHNYDNNDYKECSLEEARRIVVNTLSSYIEFRRNVAELKRIKINGTSTIPIEPLLIEFEAILERHPQLMDKKTESAVIEILNKNQYLDENKRIAETLNIDVDDIG